MVLPIGNPHPTGVTNPVTFRASAALPNAGAWDATPTIVPVALFKSITFFISYTRGAAGGAVDLQVLGSPYSANAAVVQSWFNQSEKTVGVLAAGVDTQSRIQREYDTYQATGAAIENFMYGPFDLQYIERLQIRARESGVVGTPGTLHIVAVVME